MMIFYLGISTVYVDFFIAIEVCFEVLQIVYVLRKTILPQGLTNF